MSARTSNNGKGRQGSGHIREGNSDRSSFKAQICPPSVSGRCTESQAAEDGRRVCVPVRSLVALIYLFLFHSYPSLAVPTTSPIILTAVSPSFTAATRPSMHSIVSVSPLSASSSRRIRYSMPPRLAACLLLTALPYAIYGPLGDHLRVCICELQCDNCTPAGRFFHNAVCATRSLAAQVSSTHE
jgi:hypothetical protein